MPKRAEIYGREIDEYQAQCELDTRLCDLEELFESEVIATQILNYEFSTGFANKKHQDEFHEQFEREILTKLDYVNMDLLYDKCELETDRLLDRLLRDIKDYVDEYLEEIKRDMDEIRDYISALELAFEMRVRWDFSDIMFSANPVDVFLEEWERAYDKLDRYDWQNYIVPIENPDEMYN